MKIWCLDYRDALYTDAAIRDMSRYDELDLLAGERVEGRFPTDAIVAVRSRRPPNDFFMAGPFWIVSDKLRAVLDAHGVQAEYLPVRLTARSNDPIRGTWFCFNPTLVRDWFDRSRSTFEAEQAFATKIVTVAVDARVLDDAPLAVAAKTIPELVAVRDDVAEAIVAAGCTGIILMEPEDWQDPVNPAR